MNETKKYKVIKAVVENKKQKKRACIELDLSLRQIIRLVQAYQADGKVAFVHKNRGVKHKHAVPNETKRQIITVYQDFRIKPNIKHFTEILKRDYTISYTDTTIRSILYKAKILSPKSQRKTKKRINNLIKQENSHKKQSEKNHLVPVAENHLELPEKSHPSRPRKKYKGELIQIDASSYRWFGNQITHLHLAIDDASGNIVGAYFDQQETLKGYYHVLNQILTKQGIPVTFLTDKRTVFEYKRKTTKSMEDDTFTQGSYNEITDNLFDIIY